MILKINNLNVKTKVGGFAKLATVIKTTKNDSEENNWPLLLLDAGDALQGTMYYNIFKGKSDIAVMNKIGFDAFVIGNHEFDDGDENLADFINSLTIPVISSNIISKEESPLRGKIKPFIMKAINGERIGIIGVTIVSKTVDSSNPGNDISFINEITAVKNAIKYLEAENVNKIILLSHIGYDNDLYFAENISGIDIIVGGDSHTLLGDFNSLGLKSSGNYPTIKKSRDGNDVCIVQAWEFAKAIGKLDVIFDEHGNILSCNGNLILPISEISEKIENGKEKSLNENEINVIANYIETNSNIKITKDDNDILMTINSYKYQIDEQKNMTIGFASENILHNRIPNQSYNGVKLPLGSQLAPLICKAFYMESKSADLSIQNAGGVRQSIYEGNISIGDIYNILPFSNTLYELKMTGSEIKSLIEEAINYSAVEKKSTGSFPYVYGIKYDIDLNKSYGNRVFNIEIYDKILKDWVNFNMEKTYSVVTHSYLIKGRDGYKILEEIAQERNAVNTYIEYATSFINFIKKLTKNNKPLEKLKDNEYPIKSFIDLNNSYNSDD
jgi:5'-nucleotidase